MREAHAYGDSNTYGHANGNSDRHGDFDAKTDAYTEACTDAKSSSHSGAETIEIFAIAKISSVPRRSDAQRRVTRDRCSLGRLARGDAPHYKCECAPIW